MRKIISTPSVAGFLILVLFWNSGELKANDFIKKFSLKLIAGFGDSGLGDLKAFADASNGRYADQALTYGFTRTGGLTLPHGGSSADGEVVASVSEHFGLGIGVGFLSGEKNSQVEISLPSAARVTSFWQVRRTAIPLVANACYRVRRSGRLDVFLKAGLGHF